MGKRYTVCTVQIQKMPVLERYMHVYWAPAAIFYTKQQITFCAIIVFFQCVYLYVNSPHLSLENKENMHCLPIIILTSLSAWRGCPLTSLLALHVHVIGYSSLSAISSVMIRFCPSAPLLSPVTLSYLKTICSFQDN